MKPIEERVKELHIKSREILDNHYTMLEPIMIDARYIELALAEVRQEAIEEAITLLPLKEKEFIEHPDTIYDANQFFPHGEPMIMVREFIKYYNLDLKQQLQQLKEE